MHSDENETFASIYGKRFRSPSVLRFIKLKLDDEELEVKDAGVGEIAAFSKLQSNGIPPLREGTNHVIRTEDTLGTGYCPLYKQLFKELTVCKS